MNKLKTLTIALLLMLGLTKTSAAMWPAPPSGCWVNFVKYDDPRCPLAYSAYRQVLADTYFVSCVRISPVGGFFEAERRSIGYNKTMYCIDAVWERTVRCEYLCTWTLINRRGQMILREYKIFTSPFIPDWEDSCPTCSSD